MVVVLRGRPGAELGRTRHDARSSCAPRSAVRALRAPHSCARGRASRARLAVASRQMPLQGRALGYAWAFAAATANASQDNLRKLASSRVPAPVEIVALSELVNVLVLAIAIGVVGKWDALVESAARTELVMLVAAAGGLKFACAALLQHALRLTPLSLCVPYFAFTPMFLLVVSFFLVHETPTAQGVFGVCVITLGAYLLNSNSSTLGVDGGKLEKSPRLEEGGAGAFRSQIRKQNSARGPLDQLAPADAPVFGWMGLKVDESLSDRARFGCVGRSLAKQVAILRSNPGSLITLGIAAAYALVADLDKLGKLHAPDLLVFIFMQRCFILVLPLTYVLMRRPAAFGVFISAKRTGVTLALIGLLDVASMAAFLEALNYIFTSYAVAAKRTSILASVIGGAVFFNESIAQRLPYVVIMFIGMALILLADAKKH